MRDSPGDAVKTTGQQLVEACRAHGGSDAELGAAIDQAIEQERERQVKMLRAEADEWDKDAKYRAGRNQPDSAHVSRERAAILRQSADLMTLVARKATP